MRTFVVVIVSLAAICASAAAGDSPRAPVRDPQREFQRHVRSYKEIKQQDIVMQQHDYSCGAAALATIARYYWGDDVGEATFLDLLPRLKLTEEQLKDRIENGLTLTDLRDLAHDAGYDAVMGKVQFSELAEGKLPVIVGITIKKHDHFAVFRGTDGHYVYLADSIRGNIRVTVTAFSQQWQKNAILVVARRNSGPRDVNPLAIRCEEVERGLLNDQMVHRNALQPLIPNPILFPPPSIVR